MDIAYIFHKKNNIHLHKDSKYLNQKESIEGKQEILDSDYILLFRLVQIQIYIMYIYC